MILNFQQFNERVNITRPNKGKKVLADDKLLKTMTAEEVSSNVAMYVERTGNFVFPKGKIMLWFLDHHDNVAKVGKEIEILTFPKRYRWDFDASPIDDIWKKSHSGKGTEHILGMVEAQLYDDVKQLRVEMMSVRPGFKKNKINTFMIEALRDSFKDYVLAFEDPTEDGIDFILKYDTNATVVWTISNRPKNWAQAKEVIKNVINYKEPSNFTFKIKDKED